MSKTHIPEKSIVQFHLFFVKSRLNWPVDTQLKFLAAFFSIQIVRTAARSMRNECEGDARGFN